MAENTKPKVYRGDNAVKVIERKFDVKLPPEYKRIVELEGYAVEPYKDDRGNWTTGVGQTGIYMDMTPVEAMEAKEKEVSEYIPNYATLPTDIRAEIFQLHYRGDLGQSPKFRELFNAGQYKEASVELLNHSEYKTRSKKIGASYRDGVVKRLEEASSVFSDYEGQQGMSREEQDLTQGQLERMFGETATAPSSIPDRERQFPQREVSETATNVRQLIKDSLGTEITPETPAPSMTPEEQELTQSQLERMFGETAQPEVPTSITIPGRERQFPIKPPEERAKEVRRLLITPPEEPEKIQEAIVKQEEPKPIPYEPKTITRIPSDFGQRITLEDIQRSSSLREYRALPGDVFKDGKLYRVYSEKPSKASTPEEETKLGAIQNLIYGFDRYGNTIEENVGDYLNTIIPMNASAIPTESDPYADVLAKADSDTRRDMLANQRYRDLIEEYGYETVISPPSGAAVVGGLVGSLASPTTLIPLGGTVKTGALLGAALSAGYTASADLAERGEIRVVPTASSAILGGVLGGGLAALTRPSNIVPASMLVDKNNRLLNSSDMTSRLAKLQREGKINAQQVKATYDYYNVAKPIATAEKAVTEMGPVMRNVSAAVDKYLGAFVTVLRKKSGQLADRVRRYEINSHMQIASNLKKVTPFIRSLNNLSTTTADDIAYRIGLGQFDEARNLMPVSMQTEFADTLGVLNNLGKELKKAGHTFEPIENYFPRLMKDLDGFYEELGVVLKGPIEKQIEKYAQLTGKTVATLSEDVKNDIADKVVRGLTVTRRADGVVTFIKPSGKKAGPWNKRTADLLLQKQKELMKYYSSPGEALQNYITKAVTDIEKRRVLGIHGKKVNKKNLGIEETSDGFLDVDSSLGALINEARAKGDWSIKDESEIVEMLRGYFVGGNQAPNAVLRFLRTAGYSGTIANPISAITQLGDLGVSGAMYGFRNTISAMFGEKNIKLVDSGLKSLAEFEDPKRTGAFLEKMFKYSGFEAVDRLGKETTMNAALRKAQQQAQTAAGRAKLQEKYGNVFGKEFDNFIGDLQRKEITENVKYYALNELADMQPVFLSEVPRAFIENPNGRILYMLKTFTLKQYDIVRNRIIGEYRKGNKEQAIKQAAVLAAYLSLANAGTGMAKDLLLGREVKPEQIPDRALWGLLGVYGANQYVSERYLSRGDLTGYAKNLLTPATPLLDEAFKLGGDIVGGDLEEDFLKYAKPVPIVGNIAYNWFGGGAEAYNERNK